MLVSEPQFKLTALEDPSTNERYLLFEVFEPQNTDRAVVTIRMTVHDAHSTLAALTHCLGLIEEAKAAN